VTTRAMAAPTIINWERINARLPYLRTAEHRALRRRMWTEIDCNDNGFVSLAEVTRGVRDVINVDELFECRPAINAAFHHCKSISKTQRRKEDDYLEFREFRLFLKTLRQFFEYYQAFSR